MKGKINIQLLFNGNAAEALEFYSRAFIATPTMVHKMSDAPDNYNMKAEDVDRIMHSEIQTGGLTLMISDSVENHIVTNGEMITLSLNTDTKEEAIRLFSVLSKNGKVLTELQDVFWNAHFGSLVDQFGVGWVINYSYN